MIRLTVLALVCIGPIAHLAPAQETPAKNPGWNFFPLAVWLQSPDNSARYRALGFNLYVGLWDGPTPEQLAKLKAAGMPVICEQNAAALRDPNRDIILGWMHGDEPDNAQPKASGYGPPISPQIIQENYRAIKQADPAKPVLLNLSQGVAWDGWFGRGDRTNHPEDYAEYLKGCDVASFDIYPVVHDRPEIAGRLELVPFGVDRLKQWSDHRKPIWACLECTHISNPNVKPTAEQVRTEAWMAIIHGAQGLIYFAHEFVPHFEEAGLLQDPVMTQGVAQLNREITELSPALRGASITNLQVARSKPEDAPIDFLAKRDSQASYIFAVAMRHQAATATFTGSAIMAGEVEVLGENRQIKAENGRFTDSFDPYQVHLYRLPPNP